MTFWPTTDPECATCPRTPEIATIIDARPRDIDGFAVRRLLPSAARRLVGPFIFFDHMGPAELAAGRGIDVRPHPHIGLATMTYLFDGELVHRDSLGSHQPIRPGEVNWMIAGRGIVHSERTGPEQRRAASPLHGVQLWVALPLPDEETEPDFEHHPATTLPHLDRDGASLRILAGTAYGEQSPVRALSPLFCVDSEIPAGCALTLPHEHRERAAYVIDGTIDCGAERAESGRALVFAPDARAVLRAAADARVLLVGGAPLEGNRHIWWNFVSSSTERIERAKRDWSERRFPVVPGDEAERVPLPR